MKFETLFFVFFLVQGEFVGKAIGEGIEKIVIQVFIYISIFLGFAAFMAGLIWFVEKFKKDK